MQSSQSYQGCPCCVHTWKTGPPLAQTKCVCDGYRRFLAQNSRARRSFFRYNGTVYQYGYNEMRPPARLRDDKLVRDAVTMAKQIREPFLGHKIAPLPARWPGFSWARYIPGELLHGTYCILFINLCILFINLCILSNLLFHVSCLLDSKVFTECVVKTLVGKCGSGTSYANWNRDSRHRRQAKIRGIFPEIWSGNDGPLPWRLTKTDRQLLESRMANIVWPHYMERLYYNGCSMWTAPSRMWKARRKYRLLYYILVQLRDRE